MQINISRLDEKVCVCRSRWSAVWKDSVPAHTVGRQITTEQLVEEPEGGWEGGTLAMKTRRKSGRSRGCSSPLQVRVSACAVRVDVTETNPRVAAGKDGVVMLLLMA